MDERNTKFQASAAKLYTKLAQNVLSSDKGLSDVEAFKQEQHTIIAQYAYDLLYSGIEHLRHSPYRQPMEIATTETWIHFIPDMDKWPERS